MSSMSSLSQHVLRGDATDHHGLRAARSAIDD
jgi:hypothetical protein